MEAKIDRLAIDQSGSNQPVHNERNKKFRILTSRYITHWFLGSPNILFTLIVGFIFLCLLLPAGLSSGLIMEIETHDSVPGKNLVKVSFNLGTESYTIDANKGDTVLDQLVSMKVESMRILKEFITKHNVPDDVPDEILSDGGDEDDVKCPVKPKKTKI